MYFGSVAGNRTHGVHFAVGTYAESQKQFGGYERKKKRNRNGTLVFAE